MTTRVRLTYEDYAALPDDGRRYELHEGEHAVPFYWIVDPSASTIEAHQLVDGRYRDAGSLSRATMTSLMPFPDLILDPAQIWPGQP
jgi:Uma2 family endonuclease